MKLPTQKIVHDDVILIDFLKENSVNCEEYMKETTVTKLNWSALKKDLSITNGKIINNGTGEILENIDGLFIEDVKESFDIK